jgi:hypothetical protein
MAHGTLYGLALRVGDRTAAAFHSALRDCQSRQHSGCQGLRAAASDDRQKAPAVVAREPYARTNWQDGAKLGGSPPQRPLFLGRSIDGKCYPCIRLDLNFKREPSERRQ